MNRRGFLRGLLGTAATLSLDPEKLLWVPGSRLISIPVRSPNTFLTIEQITYAILEVLHKHTIAARGINRNYNKVFLGSARIGQTLQVSKPPLLYVPSL